MRTLIVEDDLTNRLLLEHILSRYGECHVAVNGKEAIEAYKIAAKKRRRYDLFCMDILMPEMDGIAAVRQIRSLEAAKGIRSSRQSKIIMITSLDEVRDVIRSFQELCDAYLVKPIDAGHLVAQLKLLRLLG